ncbi:unnamed protein product [Schistosoma rodhaini]|uniref:Uncharacterized protein n=1 Tax=Schistosoma rodhaini TaxID=6188 RepID=A0AA85G745_9TREM|nr:unnamed protein product [Schistosoma rodhaini]
MITFIIISVFLLQSCYCGSSEKPECKREQTFIGKLWSLVESLVSLICFLNGIWNTINEWRTVFNSTLNAV